jgi:two-component system response regulator DevR
MRGVRAVERAPVRLRTVTSRERSGENPAGSRIAGTIHGMEDNGQDAAAAHKLRVFLLDDHEVVRRGLRDLLEQSGDVEVVGEAGRADEALRRIPAVRPDVAVLDARLPDGSGIEVCREVRSSMPSVACLILTSYDDDEALFAAIMAGAAGYVLKQIRGTDLVDAVRRVARGQSLLDPAVTANVLTRLREGPPASDPRFEALSDRERAVLALIADGLSNREIGARLYLAEKTVKNHVSRLLAKLQMERRTQVAVFGATMRDQGTLRPQEQPRPPRQPDQ